MRWIGHELTVSGFCSSVGFFNLRELQKIKAAFRPFTLHRMLRWRHSIPRGLRRTFALRPFPWKGKKWLILLICQTQTCKPGCRSTATTSKQVFIREFDAFVQRRWGRQFVVNCPTNTVHQGGKPTRNGSQMMRMGKTQCAACKNQGEGDEKVVHPHFLSLSSFALRFEDIPSARDAAYGSFFLLLNSPHYPRISTFTIDQTHRKISLYSSTPS